MANADSAGGVNIRLPRYALVHCALKGRRSTEDAAAAAFLGHFLFRRARQELRKMERGSALEIALLLAAKSLPTLSYRLNSYRAISSVTLERKDNPKCEEV
ncbi:hypothetical protein MTO96_000223 [Rhipicephalus appendiculatus]